METVLPDRKRVGQWHARMYWLSCSASLHNHIHRTYQFDIFSSGFVQILAAEQTQTDTRWYLGTADAVRRQIGHLLSRDAEDVLIISGDHFYRMDHSELMRFHRERQADVSLAVLPVSEADAHRFGILQVTDEGRIVAFQEKPQGAEALERLASRHGDARPYLASMGVYVFRVEALNRCDPSLDFTILTIPSSPALTICPHHG